ncbi:MAG: hypothetical protein V4620_02930 [Bacteroidota bacterium]
MKPIIIIILLLLYAFVDWPLEIIDNFLAYLIPFCISIFGLIICIINFLFIKRLENKYKKFIRGANIITLVIFSFLIVFNFPIPENRGLRCKNWTDIEMLINPNDNKVQYVYQSVEISGSIFSHRQAIVTPINSWLRWHHKITHMPPSGNWLHIDNSKDGMNRVPFPLDNTKIDFERDKLKATILTIQ